MRRSSRGNNVLWLLVITIGCGSAPPSRAPAAVETMEAETMEAEAVEAEAVEAEAVEAEAVEAEAVEAEAVEAAPAGAEPRARASSECVQVAVTPNLEPRGVTETAGPDRVSAAEATQDLSAIASTLGEMFEGLREGRAPARFVRPPLHEDRRLESARRELLATAAERRLCAERLVSLTYPSGRRHTALVEVEVQDGESSPEIVQVEMWRSADGEWRLELEALAGRLEEHARLRDTLALLRTLDRPVFSSGDRDFLRVRIPGDEESTFCVWLAADSGLPGGTRCFTARWREGDRLVAYFRSDDETLCIERRASARGRRSWVLRWPDGALHRGRCDGDPIRVGPAVDDPRSVAPPFDLAPLAGVSVAPLEDEGVSMLETLSLARLCHGRGMAMTCAPALTASDDAFISVHYDQPRIALDEDGSGWLAIRRHRGDGGAEAQAGDTALMLFRLDDERLRLHGFLPLGGYVGERLEHGEGRTVWQTQRAGHEQFDVDRAGCLTIGAQVAVDSTSLRRLPRPRVLSRTTLAPRTALPERWDGLDLVSLYGGAIEMDAAGSWRPLEGGGFQRVEGCEASASPPSP